MMQRRYIYTLLRSQTCSKCVADPRNVPSRSPVGCGPRPRSCRVAAAGEEAALTRKASLALASSAMLRAPKKDLTDI